MASKLTDTSLQVNDTLAISGIVTTIEGNSTDKIATSKAIAQYFVSLGIGEEIILDQFRAQTSWEEILFYSPY